MVHRAKLLLVELKLARHAGAELTRRVEQAVEGVEELGFEQCVRDKLREVTLRAFDQRLETFLQNLKVARVELKVEVDHQVRHGRPDVDRGVLGGLLAEVVLHRVVVPLAQQPYELERARRKRLLRKRLIRLLLHRHPRRRTQGVLNLLEGGALLLLHLEVRLALADLLDRQPKPLAQAEHEGAFGPVKRSDIGRPATSRRESLHHRILHVPIATTEEIDGEL
mmetsp:Transcript_21395/g.48200  ORF Transcript_21395/g.48200 Transcript_21395/m.48200 type:complete len:223 (-) Transcript_21395:488-1156(-)